MTEINWNSYKMLDDVEHKDYIIKMGVKYYTDYDFMYQEYIKTLKFKTVIRTLDDEVAKWDNGKAWIDTCYEDSFSYKERWFKPRRYRSFEEIFYLKKKQVENNVKQIISRNVSEEEITSGIPDSLKDL